MKIVKILLYILIINLQVHAKDNTFNAKTNLASTLELGEGVKWSLNGGVFMDVKDGIVINKSGHHEILLLGPKGILKILEVNIIDGEPEKLKILDSFYIDNLAPELHYSWENILKLGDQVIAGPNSQLFWKSDDSSAFFQVYVNDKLLESSTPPLLITKNTLSIKIKAVDVFNNESTSTIQFKQNFTAPNIEWKLAKPNILKNNKWYSKKKAKLIVSPLPGLTYKLNGNSFDITNKAIKIENNSLLTATDVLGNTASKTINWVVDKEPPSLIFKSLGEEHINIKKLNVETNQNIHLSSQDDGVGLLGAYFFSNKRKWEPLPKTFFFLSPGNYKINIKSKDKLGNSVKSKIKVRVKQSKRGWK